MSAARRCPLLICQLIGGTIEHIGRIGVVFCAASGTLVIHLCPAIGTEQKSGQRIGFAQRIMASRRFAELLRKLPRFLIHDGFVGVLKDQPVLLGIHYCVFVLVGLLMRTEVDRMPHIFRLGKNLPDDIAAPVIRVGEFLFAFPNALVLLAEVNSGRFHFIVIEDTGNVIRAFALNGQPEYPADNLCCFLVDIPTVLISRHFLVTVDGAVSGWLT